jgi:predicted lipoprotein
MSTSMVQQNILTEMQSVATQQLALKNRLEALVAMWSAENMSTLIDVDLQELAEFVHVSAQELAAAKNAMDTISAAIGAYAAGTPATKLLRIVLTVPH